MCFSRRQLYSCRCQNLSQIFSDIINFAATKLPPVFAPAEHVENRLEAESKPQACAFAASSISLLKKKKKINGRQLVFHYKVDLAAAELFPVLAAAKTVVACVLHFHKLTV